MEHYPKVVGQPVAWVVTLLVIRLLSPEDYRRMVISTIGFEIVGLTAQ